jgi:hypothetical protein
MSDVLLEYMRIGGPNGEALPQRSAYAIFKGAKMILNDE